MKQAISKQKAASAASRGKLSAMLDDEASAKQVRQVLKQVLKDKRQNQSLCAIEETWHKYNLVKNVLTTNAGNDPASGPSLRSEGFLAGVRAGVARLDDVPRLARRRSFDWLWDWGLQPLAVATSLMLMVLIGVGLGTDLMPANLGYVSLNSANQVVNQQATRNMTSTATNSLPTYTGKTIRTNANNRNADVVPVREARSPFYFGIKGGFGQEKLNAYKLDHTNRKVSVGFAPLIQLANYPDAQRHNKEASGVK